MSGSPLILLLKGPKVIRLAVPVLLRIARGSVDGSPIRINFDTDLKNTQSFTGVITQ